jgi:Uma2 family endonuclease
MTLQTRHLTYEEYLKSPETMQRYEIVDGELIMPPAPTYEHQSVLKRLFLQVNQFVVQQDWGDVAFAPVDVLIQQVPLRTRQPDLLVIRKERLAIIGPYVDGAPDLAAQVLSPSNNRADLNEKLADYYRLGVSECWLVSPEASSVEVLVRGEADWQRLGLYGLGDTIRSGILEGLELPVAKIFG